MRRTPFRFALGALIAAVSLTADASAQGGQVRPRQPQRPAAQPPAGAPGAAGAQPRRPVADGVRGRTGGPASQYLRMRQQLELTDDQVKRLETLASAAPARISEADLMRARADLMDAQKGDGNLAGVRAALDKMSKLRNDEVIARMRAGQDARAVLTAAQKTKVDNFRGALRDRAVAGRGFRERRGGAAMRGRGPGFAQGGARGFVSGRGQAGMRQRMMMGPGMGGQGFGPQGPMGPGMRGRMGGQGFGPQGGPGMGQGFGPQGPMPVPGIRQRIRRGDVIEDSVPPVPPTPASPSTPLPPQ